MHKALVLQEAKLRGAQLRELDVQALQDLTDAERAALPSGRSRRDSGHVQFPADAEVKLVSSGEL
ncbi:hypothetical protein ACFPRL_02945 [Pseudoclavibacter helvolus]